LKIWFDNLPVLGRLPPAQAAGKLREVGESEVEIARQQRPEHLEVARDSSITIKFQPCA